ncbi:unnamed protein product, partial [Iphiclides podalirius]
MNATLRSTDWAFGDRKFILAGRPSDEAVEESWPKAAVLKTRSGPKTYCLLAVTLLAPMVSGQRSHGSPLLVPKVLYLGFSPARSRICAKAAKAFL